MEPQYAPQLSHLLQECFVQKESPSDAEYKTANNNINPHSLLTEIKEKISLLEKLIIGRTDLTIQKQNNIQDIRPKHNPRKQPQRAARVIDGVFDGEHMIDEEAKRYEVPQNYASKSKLVEGDLMQLLVMPEGKMFYKQIERVERTTLHGFLKEENGNYLCEANGRCYSISMASITYWRVKPGDRMIITVPKNGESTWAAVEDI
jgi:hypothetical protein